MIGNAAFLLPDGRIDPESVAPPSTMNCTAAMSSRCGQGVNCLTLDFATRTIRSHQDVRRASRFGGWPQPCTLARRRHGRANDSSHAEG